MATQVYTLTTEWQLIVAASLDFRLSADTENASKPFVVAISDTETAPAINTGHPVFPNKREAVYRQDVGPGYLYAKLQYGSDMRVVVTPWASS